MSGSVEAVPPAAVCDRSVGARRAARLMKAGREESIIGLSNRDVSVAGIAAREGLRAKRARAEMAPQRLEKVESEPGNGMAPAAPDSQYLVQRRAATVVPKNSRRLSPDGRGNERHARRACLGRAAASRPEMVPQRLEIIESAPGDGMAPNTSKPQDLAPGRGRACFVSLSAAS